MGSRTCGRSIYGRFGKRNARQLDTAEPTRGKISGITPISSVRLGHCCIQVCNSAVYLSRIRESSVDLCQVVIIYLIARQRKSKCILHLNCCGMKSSSSNLRAARLVKIALTKVVQTPCFHNSQRVQSHAVRLSRRNKYGGWNRQRISSIYGRTY